ncbi:hypothetical protein C8R44DRAFT_875173 [Mycena epipterygia]|nr:hypothetical protein C8R44DRAFT_875173 [Mycena epipterygia]
MPAVNLTRITAAEASKSAPTYIRAMFTKPGVLIPSPLPWKVEARGIPSSSPDWEKAFKFVLQNEQWAILHALLVTYFAAAAVDMPNRNTYERNVIANFRVPTWYWNKVRPHSIDKKRVAEVHAFWSSMMRPVYGDLPSLAAAWFQYHECPPPGVRAQDAYGTLSLRAVRGALLWERIAFDRKRNETGDRGSRKKYDAIARAVMTMLAVPNAYRRDLETDKITVAPAVKLENWPGDQTDELTDNIVVRCLAKMRFTIEMADDFWYFCHEYLVGLKEQPQAGWPIDEVDTLLAASEEGTTPPRFTTRHPDLFPRPGLLPWKLKDNNKVQDLGMLANGAPGNSSHQISVNAVPSAPPSSAFAVMPNHPSQAQLVYSHQVHPQSFFHANPAIPQQAVFTTIPPNSTPTSWNFPAYPSGAPQGLHASMHAPYYVPTQSSNRPASISAADTSGSQPYYSQDATMTNATPEAAFDVSDLNVALGGDMSQYTPGHMSA